MGEIFKREKAVSALAFSGERVTGAVDGQIEIEHYHRYLLARGMARGSDVLDIAAGEGYGSALLAQVAHRVWGVEIDAETVTHASSAYARDNLRFIKGDALSIPLEDATVDLAVSFETIEHFYEHDRFLTEIRRVLRPNGAFIVSTPDRDNYSSANSPANRHHVHELTATEFVALLKKHFAHVEVLAQRPMIGSAILPVQASVMTATGESVTFERRGDSHFEACSNLPRALYLIAVASDQPITIPRASLYIESSQLAEREALWARTVAHSDVFRLSSEQARREAERARREAEQARREAEHARREAEQAHQETEGLLRLTAALQSSTSWKLTAPLRGIMGWLRPHRPTESRTEAPAPPPDAAPITPPSTYGEPLTDAERQGQRKAFGMDLPPPRLALSVGIVTFNTDPNVLARAVRSALGALERTGGEGRLLLIDNGAPSEALPGVLRLPTQGNVGFGRAHNILMNAAFADGADAYVAMNPDGALHPDALTHIARVIDAHQGRALVEAMQFPAEHPKVFDPLTGETEWASGACMTIPRAVFEATGGFDEAFFMYCEDVDLSWRVRASGMKVIMAPHALFLHAVTNRDSIEATRKAMLTSAVLLGQKWDQPDFAAAAVHELMAISSPVPTATLAKVPPAWRAIPDFTKNFSFSRVRW